MIIVTFNVKLEQQIMQILGKVEAENVSITVKVRGDVGEGIVEKLKEIGAIVLNPVK